MSIRGFTLVEMAVVMVIMGFIMAAFFPALTSLRNASERSVTQNNLRALMTATASYVQANGCVPCPTPATATRTFPATGFGYVRGDTSTSVAGCGICSIVEGVAPFISLGLPMSTARDGWGNWITMRVDPALTINFGATAIPPSAPCTTTDVTGGICTSAQIGFSEKGLCKSGLSTTNRITVTTSGIGSQKAAVIFVSHGSHGYGSYIAGIPASLCTGDEVPFPAVASGCQSTPPSCPSTQSSGLAAAECNASHTTQFVNAPSGSDTSYDDMMVFADRNSLVSMFGNGSCQTVW